MSWIGGLLSAGGSILGGLFGSNAAGSAASAQEQAANQASQTQLQMFNQLQQNLQPYMGAGTNALAAYQSALGLGGGTGGAPGFNAANFQTSPGYNFAKQQGIDAIMNSAAAHGLTGNTLRSLDQFGTGLANQEFNQYLGQLSGLTGMGQNAAAGVGNAGLQTGQAIGQNIIGAGNAAAGGIVGGAQALTGGINSGIMNWLLSNQMNQGGGAGGTFDPSMLGSLGQGFTPNYSLGTALLGG